MGIKNWSLHSVAIVSAIRHEIEACPKRHGRSKRIAARYGVTPRYVGQVQAGLTQLHVRAAPWPFARFPDGTRNEGVPEED
jgi:hypothetical protein